MATVLDFSQEERGKNFLSCHNLHCLFSGKTGLEGNAAGWLAGILGQHRSRQETAMVYKLVDFPALSLL